ncbi:MAG: hypothetical protein SCH71_17475 [Desulfobulbaceae bacterium]|nr:hypothetical protein [Desulfobulbaceae bacterium]
METWKFITVASSMIGSAGVIVGFGAMIYRQGRFFGKMTEHQNNQDTKIKKNCLDLQDLTADFHNFKTSFDTGSYMTVPIHAGICSEKRDTINKRLDDGAEEFKTIRTALKEDRELIHSTRLLLAEVNALLPVVQEQLKTLQART